MMTYLRLVCLLETLLQMLQISKNKLLVNTPTQPEPTVEGVKAFYNSLKGHERYLQQPQPAQKFSLSPKMLISLELILQKCAQHQPLVPTLLLQLVCMAYTTFLSGQQNQSDQQDPSPSPDSKKFHSHSFYAHLQQILNNRLVDFQAPTTQLPHTTSEGMVEDQGVDKDMKVEGDARGSPPPLNIHGRLPIQLCICGSTYRC